MSHRPDDFDALVAGYLVGDLTLGQRQRLLSMIQESTALESDFLRELDMHGALRIVAQESIDGSGRKTESDAFIDELFEVYRSRQTTPIGEACDAIGSEVPHEVAALPRPIPMPRRRSTNTMWAMGVAIAACLVLGMLLIFATQSRTLGPEWVERHGVDSVDDTPPPVLVEHDLPWRPQAPVPQVLDQKPIIEPRMPAPVQPEIQVPIVRHDPPSRPVAPIPQTPEPAVLPAPQSMAVARFETVDHGVSVFRAGNRIEAKPGMVLHASDLIVTGSPERDTALVATVLYEDRTRVSLAVDTQATFDEEDGAKHVNLRHGRLACDVAKQPPGRFMVLTTAQAQSLVLGTQFVLDADARRTRLEVTEGRVRIKSTDEKHNLTIGAGFFTEIGDVIKPLIRPLHMLAIDDVPLLPSEGKAVGDTWQLVDDVNAKEGSAWRSAPLRSEDFKPQKHWVEFEFDADADRPYWVWVRGHCLIPGTDIKERNHSDQVLLELTSGGKFFLADSKRLKDPRHNYGPNVGLFNGWAHHPGTVWLGGNEDENIENRVAVTFEKSGRQKLRMRLMEGPMQISGIWLSTTQADRPASDRYPKVEQNKR